MLQQTLKEMDQAEAAARNRAYKFGRAKDAAFSANSRLKTLEDRLASPQPDVRVLQDIVALAKQMPVVVTQGNSLRPGGENLQMLIIREVEIALGVMADQRKALVEELPKARELAIDANARLAAFND